MKVALYVTSKGLLERHHCMFGPNRKLSEKYGLIIPLCMECHRGNKGWSASQQRFRFIHKKNMHS